MCMSMFCELKENAVWTFIIWSFVALEYRHLRHVFPVDKFAFNRFRLPLALCRLNPKCICYYMRSLYISSGSGRKSFVFFSNLGR